MFSSDAIHYKDQKKKEKVQDPTPIFSLLYSLQRKLLQSQHAMLIESLHSTTLKAL